jgi:hemerythrin-like domain-containing protein/uncharacterized protein (DUF2249 family)
MKTSIPLTNASHRHPETATPTAMLRHEHEVVLRTLALLERLGRGLGAGEAVDRAALEWLTEFFHTFVDRCHHGKEEQHLFPALERHGVPRQGGPLGVMLQEHEEGRAFLRAMTAGDDRATARAIRGYAALLRAHIDKENGVLFPIAEQVLAAEEQRVLVHAFDAMEQVVAGPGVHERLLAKLAELEAGSGVTREQQGGQTMEPSVLDVRPLVPRERHPRIFEAFDRLKPGQKFILVNDHDPKPLYYQFSFERAGAFTWYYVEEGPEVWRVEIGKK